MCSINEARCVHIRSIKFLFVCPQLSALEKDLSGLKSPSAGDVAAVLDSYQEQVSKGVLFCLLPKQITRTLTAPLLECFRCVCLHALR